jgi:hypothetical protein
MPSASYVAQALFSVGADTEWDDASDEVRESHMVLARAAIAAVVSWQAVHRGNGLARYYFERSNYGWSIYDRNAGSASLGAVNDAILAQMIIDDLNKRETKKDMRQTLNELVPKSDAVS